MGAGIIRLQGRIRAAIENEFCSKGHTVFWPAQFVSKSGDPSLADVEEAFRKLEASGYLVEHIDVSCPSGHRLFQGPIRSLKIQLKDFEFTCNVCKCVDKGEVVCKLNYTAEVYFKVSEDWIAEELQELQADPMK